MPNYAVAIVAIIGVMIMIFGGFYAIDQTATNSRHAITIENESFTPQDGQISRFNNSELKRADYNDDETVRFDNGTIVDESGNYTWFNSNGTLRTTSGSELASVSSALVTYNYTGQTLEQTKTTNIIFRFQELLVPFAFIIGVAMLTVTVLSIGRAL